MARGFQKRRGFTLLELAIVVSVIAVVTASGMMMGSSMIESAKRASTNNKLDAIEAALMAYRMAYNRLPCPTDATLTESSSNFGYEAGHAVANSPVGSCIGGTPAANFTTNAAGPYVGTMVEGAVPVRTLNLPDEYQVDAWGHKIGYAVWTPITAASGFVTYGITPSCGGITVKNAGGGVRTTTGNYALISYGPDGHGAYLKSGTRINAGSTNADEQTNAHYDNNGNDTGYLATYVQHDWTQSPTDSLNIFDDFVRYRERWQMQNAYDGYSPFGRPCTLGFRIDGIYSGGYGSNSGWSVTTGDVNCDGIPDLIIGAPGVSTGGGEAGAVYVVFGTKSGFPDPLLASSLNGSNGFVINGTTTYEGSGISVAAGDINGDGCADIVAVANQFSAAFVVYGQSTWARSSYTLNNNATTGLINGTNGFEVTGLTSMISAQYYASAVITDVNNDGYGDLIFGLPKGGGWWPGRGSVYILYGAHNVSGVPAMKNGTAWGSSVALSTGTTPIDGTNGFEYNDASTGLGYNAGTAVAAGDVNGDGTKDIIIGAPESATGGVGVTYVVYGGMTLPSTTIITTSGSSTATVASYTNLVVGQTLYSTNLAAGTTISACGGGTSCTSTTLTLSANASAGNGVTPVAVTVVGMPLVASSYPIDATHGFSLIGPSGSADTGFSLATGDINGDGYSDIVIGEIAANGGYWFTSGQVFVVFGGPTEKNGTAWSASNTMNSTFMNGGGTAVNGFELDSASGAYAGYSVAAGDVNGDGKADIIIGGPYGSPNGSQSGEAYVVFGKATGWTTPQTLNSTFLNGTNGVELDGPTAGMCTGWSVGTVDINDDGIPEVMIGAPVAKTNLGSTYVYYGKKTGWPSTPYSLGGLCTGPGC